MQVRLVVPPNTAVPQARSRMFPVLVFLLMACYGLLALVVVEQGKVIRSQRSLITQLAQDSQQLNSLQGQEAAQNAINKKRAQAEAKGKKKACANCAVPQTDVPQTGVPQTKEQAQKLLSGKSVNHKSRLEKQPMQADDKVDRRRFPSQI